MAVSFGNSGAGTGRPAVLANSLSLAITSGAFAIHPWADKEHPVSVVTLLFVHHTQRAINLTSTRQ